MIARLICHKNTDNNRWRLCYDCWKSIGCPKDEKELHAEIEKRPNLISALQKAGRI